MQITTSKANILTTGAVLIFVAIVFSGTGNSLRTGAPALACLNLRPFHGLHRPKPASASQFFVSQSSLSYASVPNISVEVATHSNERYFRGYIVQAYDPSTGAQIGHFVSSSDVRPIDSCSAATHRNNINKHSVILTWIPPTSGSSDPMQQSAASQWLGLRPVMNVNLNTQERRPEAQEAAPGESARATSGGKQVRFRASIVVTYEEFYTGFESSDQSFEKFDFAKESGNQSRAATDEISSTPQPASN